LLFFLFLFGAYATKITPDVALSFSSFQAKYGKSYSSTEEFTKRLGIFADNLNRNMKLNAEHVAAGGEEVFGITKFMDLTQEEFKGMYLTAKPNSIADEDRVVPQNTNDDDVDWRTKGVLTPVKDQGQCGSCWAFSAVDAIESYGKLFGNYSLKELSTQQVNACDKVDEGCNGGNTESAYEYVVEAGGIETESDYPYTAGGGKTGKCKFSAAKVAVKITGYKGVKEGEDNLLPALQDGPASVCVAANAFQTYEGGILKMCPGRIDHCVQTVGVVQSDNYWVVRNSWGTDWGEKGFIRLEMGKNICKIGNDITYPTF
jgi:C1A family cysteine protease